MLINVENISLDSKLYFHTCNAEGGKIIPLSLMCRQLPLSAGVYAGAEGLSGILHHVGAFGTVSYYM